MGDGGPFHARGFGEYEPDTASHSAQPRIASFAFELLDDLIGDDRRFFFFDPSRPDRDYNYDDNQRLVDAIGKGYRGAYWDILRRYE